MRLLLFAVALALGACSAIDVDAGPTCRKGCPCGNTCISCEKECHTAPGTAKKAAPPPKPKPAPQPPPPPPDPREEWAHAKAAELSKKSGKDVRLEVGTKNREHLALDVTGCDQGMIDGLRPLLANEAKEHGFTVLRCFELTGAAKL